jgi:nicotinamide-nucleotide amidase
MYDETTIESIKELLIVQHQTIAVAESVTAGHMQAALASAENASKFFQGGITAYNLGQKARHLEVEPIHAEACNSVSEQVASQMARNVTQLFASDWGIGITGYAAPVPECSVDEPYAFYAIAFKDKVLRVEKITARPEDPIRIQVLFVNTVLKDFNDMARLEDQSSFSSIDRSSINSKFASAGPLRTSPSIE